MGAISAAAITIGVLNSSVPYSYTVRVAIENVLVIYPRHGASLVTEGLFYRVEPGMVVVAHCPALWALYGLDDKEGEAR
jgi:hypothetical protein